MHELLTACSVLNCQLVWCACVVENSHYGVDHTPHCRPRTLFELIMYGNILSCRIYHHTKTKNRPHLSRLSGLLSRSLKTRGALCCLFENVSLWPLGHDTLLCAHGTIILTNHEPSELVGECIFYAFQVRTQTIQEKCPSENFSLYNIV